LSRHGIPPEGSTLTVVDPAKIDYRQGDARQANTVGKILQDGGEEIAGIVHCIGLLFDDASGLGSYNRFVSGSGLLPDQDSMYDTITCVTAFHVIDAALDYSKARKGGKPLPFCLTSAAEAGWLEVSRGEFIESIMPDFIKHYMKAKQAVEAKLLKESNLLLLRPVIVRP
jgi:hypothetical protein